LIIKQVYEYFSDYRRWQPDWRSQIASSIRVTK